MARWAAAHKFVIPTGVFMGRRPTQGDEKRLLCSNCSPWARYPPPCHPERSRGTCGSADLSWKCFSTERSAAEGPAVPLSAEANVPWANRLQVPFSMKANRRSLGYARDDKVEGRGPPWHEWRWLDRVEKKANLDKSDSQPSPSTSSGQALRDWFRYTLIGDLFSASAVQGQGVDCASL